MIRFISGVGLSMATLLAAYALEGGAPLALLGLTAFLITFLMPLFGVLAIWTWSAWIRAWQQAFRRTTDAAAVAVSTEIWKFSEFACYLSGLVAFLVGLVLILGNLNVPQEQIARAFGAGLIAPLYGLLFGFVCRILRARVESLNK